MKSEINLIHAIRYYYVIVYYPFILYMYVFILFFVRILQLYSVIFELLYRRVFIVYLSTSSMCIYRESHTFSILLYTYLYVHTYTHTPPIHVYRRD